MTRTNAPNRDSPSPENEPKPGSWLARLPARVSKVAQIASFAVGVHCTAAHEWPGPTVVFVNERATRPAVLALRDPSLGPSLAVQAKLFAVEDGPALDTWMVVDSGATYVTLAEEAAQRLALRRLPGVRFKISAMAGRSYDKDGVLVPALAMGSVRLRSVLASVVGDTSILGQSVLGHSPWEIDWDRGTLTLNAAVWPDDTPDMTIVPLRHEPTSNTDVLGLDVGGRTLDVLLDTGAVASALPASAATGLSSRSFESTLPFHGLIDPVPVHRQLYGDARLGALALGSRGFAEIEGSHDGVGTLGLDLLARFHIQVVPGKRLALRRRGDLWTTARDRIGRWPWTAECPNLGCLRAHVAPSGGDAKLSLVFDRAYPIDATVVLGCSGDPAPIVSTSEILAQGGKMRGTFHHLVADVGAGASGTVDATVRLGGGAWLARPEGCGDPSVLDVIPTLPKDTPAAPLSAYLSF